METGAPAARTARSAAVSPQTATITIKTGLEPTCWFFRGIESVRDQSPRHFSNCRVTPLCYNVWLRREMHCPTYKFFRFQWTSALIGFHDETETCFYDESFVLDLKQY